jgi:hypothetical protein
MRRISLIASLVVLFSCTCLAAEYPYIYKGFRPMGMGGAFVAVSNDANALFYNPAGLADNEKIRASIFGLEIEMGKNAYGLYKDALDVDFGNVAESAQFLRDYMGERSHLGLAIVPSFAMSRFALAVFGTARSDLEVRDRQYPKIDVDVVSDFGFGAGYAHPIMENTLLVGASAKYVHRQSLTQEYTVADISDKLSDTIRLNVIFVRAGLYQGYFTAGLNLEAKVVRLDLLTYAEEIGTFAGQRVDRRYAGRFVIGF